MWFAGKNTKLIQNIYLPIIKFKLIIGRYLEDFIMDRKL
jgi:hypothetical protein